MVWAIQFVSLHFREKSLGASRITPPVPDGWAEPLGAPGKDFALQGSVSLENRDPWPLLATSLQLGFIAINGDNLLGVRLIALSVRKDVIYLTGGTTLAPKKIFSLSCSPLDLKTPPQRLDNINVRANSCFLSKVVLWTLHSSNLQETFCEITENEFSTSNIFLPHPCYSIFYFDFFLQPLWGNLTPYFQVFTASAQIIFSVNVQFSFQMRPFPFTAMNF